ncbi:hypothetical protein BJ165DRAFT_1604685 [Panaeolus papilionaceus]|nr:hypothetical protein BJ165DRAFT_1604685 [Panaeolus papilionaceus]
MAFSNPLHAPISSNQTSGFSTLSGAMPMSATGPANPKCKRLAQQIYYPSSKWHSATKRPAVHPSISFDYKGRRGSGIPMSDLSARGIPGIVSMMEGGDDKVLAGTGHSRISFRIMWPGYEGGSEWVRSIDIMATGPVNRAQLGQIIAQNFARFIEKHRDSPCSVPESRIAGNNIRFEHLVLVSLYNTFDDSWQADVIVDLK